MLDRLTMATRFPSSSGIYIHVIAVDAGFGCVELVVAGTKKGICFIAHISYLKCALTFSQERT